MSTNSTFKYFYFREAAVIAKRNNYNWIIISTAAAHNSDNLEVLTLDLTEAGAMCDILNTLFH